MMISHSHRFIFFHVPKTAGMSIRNELLGYTQELERFKFARPPQMKDNKPNLLYEIWQNLLLHATAKETRKELPEDVFNSYYKFAFVRNPWDNNVSRFHFLKKKQYKPLENIHSFEQYLEWVHVTPKHLPVSNGQMHKDILNCAQLQKDILVDDADNLLVDFVGKYENLAQDFSHICNILGIKATLPHLNNSEHRDYRSYYTDTTREMVAHYFKGDIEMFGYTFE